MKPPTALTLPEKPSGGGAGLNRRRDDEAERKPRASRISMALVRGAPMRWLAVLDTLRLDGVWWRGLRGWRRWQGGALGSRVVRAGVGGYCLRVMAADYWISNVFVPILIFPKIGI